MKKNQINKLVSILAVLAVALSGGTYLTVKAAEPWYSDEPADIVQAGENLPDPLSGAVLDAPEAEPEPAKEPEYFTINMIGDCTLASVAAYVGTPDGYDTVVGDDYAYPFAKTVQYFQDDDFTFANLECCLTDSNDAVAKTFTFKADESYAKIMSAGSVEFVTLANNHILDYGSEGVSDTRDALDLEGISYAGRDEYAVYKTDSGLTIGVYAVSFPDDVKQIEKGIAALKELGVEFIIAAIHWGDEGTYNVGANQITWGHAAIDAGADIVYGSHPHTLQPVEEYNGHYIYYSMGNWTFGGNTNPRDKDTFILRLTVERAPDGKVSIVAREHIPCACSGDANGNNYQPVPYEEGSEEYERTLSKLDGSFTGQNLSIGYSYSANE
ncbi:MAG: CapA family protein [Butyricicoccus sp.]|nr:CapA family protein [Butyricicoccus sp.]